MGEKSFFDPGTKKERFDPKTKKHVDIEEDEHFKKRLEYLRNQSNNLNRSLQLKLEKAELPYYSWNKSTKKEGGETNEIAYPKVLRLAVLLRPEFYHSSEQKNSQTRYTSGDDQGTLFYTLLQIIKYNKFVFIVDLVKMLMAYILYTIF